MRVHESLRPNDSENVNFSRLQLQPGQVQTLQDTKNESDVSCRITHETTTVMSHLHFFKKQFLRAHVSFNETSQMRARPFELLWAEYSVSIPLQSLVHMKIRSNWGSTGTARNGKFTEHYKLRKGP